MAAKFCINCGKPLAEGAKFCAECGAHVPNNEQAAQPVSQVYAQPYESYPAVNRRPKKGPVIAIAAGGAAIITALVVIFVLLINNGSPLSLPYGLHPGMSIYESQKQMTDSGFVKNWSSEGNYGITVFYYSSLELGYETDFATLDHDYDGESISVTLFYDDYEITSEIESAKFKDIKQRLTDKYGKPEKQEGICRYEWHDDEYVVYLNYIDDEDYFAVGYSYIEGRED